MSQVCLLLCRQRPGNNSAAWMAVGKRQKSTHSAEEPLAHLQSAFLTYWFLCGRICPSRLVSRARAVRAVGSSCCSSGSDWGSPGLAKSRQYALQEKQEKRHSEARQSEFPPSSPTICEQSKLPNSLSPPNAKDSARTSENFGAQGSAPQNPAGDFEAPARGAAQGSRGPGRGPAAGGPALSVFGGSGVGWVFLESLAGAFGGLWGLRWFEGFGVSGLGILESCCDADERARGHASWWS